MLIAMVYGRIHGNGHRSLARGNHITIDRATSLCGLPVGNSWQADVTKVADCQRCRRFAKQAKNLFDTHPEKA